VSARRQIALGVTGASGAAYALRLLEVLLAGGNRVHLMISTAGRLVLATETDLNLPARPAEIEARLTERFSAEPGQLRAYADGDWMAPVASGSNPPDAMVVCPCTTGTLAAIAAGYGRTLLDRAADVALKEGRKLILVPREMPFSVLHLENMLRLARAGAVIMPPNPGFYHRPESITDLVDFVIARILDHLDVEHDLSARWGEPE
jgi:4-hydroxy-3-polyprenylbenzoate decarboxylase